MSIITKVLQQTAVYWAPGPLDKFGKGSFLAPVEIDCRWENTSQEVINSEGTRVMTKALVMVGGDVEVGGMLALADMDSLSDTLNPRNAGAWEIVSFSKIPNMRVAEYVRTAFL